MIYNIYPTKDTTVYNYSASMNTGLDPILEIQKTIPIQGATANVARSFLQVDWATGYKEVADYLAILLRLLLMETFQVI